MGEGPPKNHKENKDMTRDTNKTVTIITAWNSLDQFEQIKCTILMKKFIMAWEQLEKEQSKNENESQNVLIIPIQDKDMRPNL